MWMPAGRFRSISMDGWWTLTRDGAFRLRSTITGETFTYDCYAELAQDVARYGAGYAAQALGLGL